jgi:FAD/FMN-containing dehydrogenase
MINRRPALIARCSGVADVIAAVRFARERNLLVAVRGGGHNVAGTAVCDDGLVIDLTALKGIWVDPTARTAQAEPGLLWGEFDQETQRFGLATTGGIVTHTGLAGLTLGGGLGWLMRKHGLTCDNLLSAEVVTADGEFLRASPEENADLFWGIRGGGGNFGIVTSFEFQLHPLGPEVLAGSIVYPAEQAEKVLRAYRDFIATAPAELGTIVILTHAPAVPWLANSVHGRPIVIIAVCYAGSITEAERVVAPLRALGEPLADILRPTTYATNQGMLDAGVPHGLHYYWKSHYSGQLSDAAISTLVAHAWQTHSPASYTIIFHMGGAVRRLAEEATAFSGRTAEHAINIDAAWPSNLAEGSEDMEWVRQMWSALVPFSTGGVYMFSVMRAGSDQSRMALKIPAPQRSRTNTNPPIFPNEQNIKPSCLKQRLVIMSGLNTRH